MSRIGIAISGGPNPAEMIDLVVLAESLGYESAWIAEGHGGDQFAILAACATRTSRILLGTGISSVFVRTAPTIAMAASTTRDDPNGESLKRNRWFESGSLQRRVRLSPGAAFEGREPRLSARLCAAGLATGSAETRRVLQDRAKRRQYLCRAIFQYRSAADGVGENATPVPIKSGVRRA